jgi:hypothetical protein
LPLAFCLKPITFVPQQTEKRYNTAHLILPTPTDHRSLISYASLERVVRFGSSIGFKQKWFFPDGLDWVVSDLLLEMAVILGDNP